MSAGFKNALSIKEKITLLAVDVGHQVPQIAQIAFTRAQTGFQPKTPQPPSCRDANLNVTFECIDESTSFCATGQQEDAQDAGGGAAGEEGAGAGGQEGPEEHERPHLGRDQPLRSTCVRVRVHDLLD